MGATYQGMILGAVASSPFLYVYISLVQSSLFCEYKRPYLHVVHANDPDLIPERIQKQVSSHNQKK
jgi:hypothetical protein